VVISASHNPHADNGIKFFSRDGFKQPDAVEAEIERLLDEPIGCNPSEKLGRAQRVDDAQGRYVEFCKSTFPNELDLKGMTIVVDCAHGAAYDVAPKVFHELGATVSAIGVAPDGFNINDMFGATARRTGAGGQAQEGRPRHRAGRRRGPLVIVDARARPTTATSCCMRSCKHRAARRGSPASPAR
jgi:phosphoglucosamine mutase